MKDGKGIADRILFFLKPENGLRSDRVQGLIVAAATVFATVTGNDPVAAAEQVPGVLDQMAGLLDQLFSGWTGFSTSLAALLGGIGIGNAANSKRSF